MSTLKWLPLESNPDVMNRCLRTLGVPEHLGVSDIITLEEEFLHMIPQPTYAILLLFPISQKYEEYCDKVENAEVPEVEGLYFMKQTIRNACGTIALIHALANNEEHLGLAQDSVMKKFLDNTRSLSPEERGIHLEENMDITAMHEESALEGQTEAPSSEDEVNMHFIAIVEVSGKLFELDGRKSAPVFHGNTSADTFVQDAVRVCKEYMARDPNNLNFNALSFGAMNF